MKRTLNILALCAIVSINASDRIYQPDIPFTISPPRNPDILFTASPSKEYEYRDPDSLKIMLSPEVQAAATLDQELCYNINAAINNNDIDLAIGYAKLRQTLDTIYGKKMNHSLYKLNSPKQACILNSNKYTDGELKLLSKTAYNMLINRKDLSLSMNTVLTHLGSHYQDE